MKTKVAVLDDFDGSVARLDCWRRLDDEFIVQFFSESMANAALADFDVIVTIRERTIVDRKFLDGANSIKHLALTGRLSGQADLEALKEKGVAVSYTEGSGLAAAELTIGLLVSVMKGLHRHHFDLKSGGWQNGLGKSLSKKTLGVLGLGRIGSKVAAFGNLMDMNVVSWGPTADNGRSEKLGVKRLSLDEVLVQSDALVVCLRLSEKTHHLLKARELALLKNGAVIVNTSRAEVFEKQTLYAELSSGRLDGAFDVFHEEPLALNDPIRSFPNVLLSPHMGYVTEDVFKIFFSEVVENILAWKNGLPFKRV